MIYFKRFGKYFVLAVLAFFVLVFVLQMVVVPSMGGADGSFGLRPQTQVCLGLPIHSDFVSWLPKGFVEMDTVLRFRYQVSPLVSDRYYCLGQDMWFGE